MMDAQTSLPPEEGYRRLHDFQSAAAPRWPKRTIFLQATQESNPLGYEPQQNILHKFMHVR